MQTGEIVFLSVVGYIIIALLFCCANEKDLYRDTPKAFGKAALWPLCFVKFVFKCLYYGLKSIILE